MFPAPADRSWFDKLTTNGDKLTMNGNKLTTNGDKLIINGNKLTTNDGRLITNGNHPLILSLSKEACRRMFPAPADRSWFDKLTTNGCMT